jgi:hypothetical protein
VTCPPWLNTAHIPQHTYIQVGDETHINLDYTKIKGAGKLCTRVINNTLIKKIYSWKMAHTAGARKLKCNSVLLEVNTKENRTVRSSDK